MSNPYWWKHGVFYQIYPRSFMDSNGDGVGDLPGITNRLEYIADLGVDCIWISPFFESPMKDFGYDVSNYRNVDPLFGSNHDFDILLKKAHGLGLKIIVDMVMSHTSIEHSWFKESRTSGNNPKADWYVWADAKPDGTPPNNWHSVFGGSAWTFDTKRQQYYLHNFLIEQPDLNFHHPEVQKQVLSDLEYWLERGVDGFRFDVCNFYFHDKMLRDNPPCNKDRISSGVQVESPYPYTMQNHLYDKSQPENLDFLKRVRALLDRYPDVMSIGELGDDNPFALAASYTNGTKRLHTTYNTHMMTGNGGKPFHPSIIINPFIELDKYMGDGWPSWAFTNHDVVRVATRWGKDIQDKHAFAAILNKLLLSLRGTPFLYQGDELGLTEAVISYEQIQDPWGKTMWPEFVGRDGCRTPMPWNKDAMHGGFVENPSQNYSPWLPIPSEHYHLAVDVQTLDKNSVLNQTRDFIQWRKTKPLLQSGDIRFDFDAPSPLIIFDRFDIHESITCVFNLGQRDMEYKGKKIQAFDAIFIEQ